MPTMDGFQFIQKLKNKDFPVVITTAYNQYAIKALKKMQDKGISQLLAVDGDAYVGVVHLHNLINEGIL